MMANNTDLSFLPLPALEAMQDSAQVILETMRVLQNTDTNIVAELLKTTDKFYEWNHIPADDVYDRASHAQYYYHTHSKTPGTPNLHDDEHGHFHTFIRGKGIPASMSPYPAADLDPDKPVSDVTTHLIGIAMDKTGKPMRLFTTNRWVTGEVFYAAPDIIALLDRFEIDHAQPSWPVNLWVTNMIRLFRPQIEQLVAQRDSCIKAFGIKHPGDNVFENRELEVTSHLDISLMDQMDAIETALARRAA
jgi:hypothetical protein